ncbi:ABC transporter ATP-binding protein [Mesorhizobium sp. 2RAF21]|uniref:ABC transporter ATP-binding protein n=1 Tax=Mesorhizobium sp. 2RAF21 TaxID=3232995 RepID=UPI003F9882CD
MLMMEKGALEYGPVQAVRNVSITVNKGELVVLLGPNGAGKSSTIKALSGLHPLASGRVFYRGRDITNVSVEDRTRLGIAVTPEGRHVFANLTVGENLRLGAATRKDKDGVKADIEAQLQFFPVLKDRYGQLAGTLSGGEQQMLAISRSLMSRPKVLLLDEPSLGIAPKIVEKIFDFIGKLKAEGLTLLVVEQNAAQALRFADRAYVMSAGVVRYEGSAEELMSKRDLLNLYIGA